MLELKDIIGYLPHGLKVQREAKLDWQKGTEYETDIKDVRIKNGLYIHDILNNSNTYWSAKPLLHPLSSLTEEITVNGETFVPMEVLWKSGWSEYIDNNEHKILEGDISEIPHYIVLNFFYWKIDVYGLIDKGLAVAVTPENNPY